MPYRIVTVDDEEHIHVGLDSLIDWRALGFEHSGFSVNGAEGLTLVDDLRPEVVITDIRMPVLDGLELIRRIRMIPDYHPVILVLSGYDDFEYARAALRYEVGDYLLKPVDEDELAGRLIAVKALLDDPSVVEGLRDESAVRLDRIAAMSNLVRRILLSSPSAELTRAARRIFPGNGGAFFFSLVVPLDLPSTLSVEAVRSAFGESGRGFVSVAYQDEYPGCVGLLTWIADAGRADPGGIEQVTEHARAIFRKIRDALSVRVYVISGPSTCEISRAWESRSAVSNALVRRLRVIEEGTFVVPAEEQALTVPRAEITAGAEGLIDAVEAEKSELAADRAAEAFEAFRVRGAPADGVRDWIYRFTSEVEKLAAELDGEIGPQVAELRDLARHIEVTPISVVAARAKAAAVSASTKIRELRHLARFGVVQLMKRRTERHFAQELSVAEFAESYGMNTVYLGQLFSRVMKMSFREFLRLCRVQEARRLLRDTDLKVSQISRSVGYRDVDHFHEQFRKVTGTTPAAYRSSVAQS